MVPFFPTPMIEAVPSLASERRSSNVMLAVRLVQVAPLSVEVRRVAGKSWLPMTTQVLLA